MRTFNIKLAGAFAALMVLAPMAIGAEDAPPFASATEAYRQGAAGLKAGQVETALPALAFAADRGVLGAQLKLARLYAKGHGLAKDDGKAFGYYRQIADQHADITPLSPVAKYVSEAFVALGEYYVEGIPSIALQSDPARAASLYRHAASYFGNADAQYRLARLYLSGDGVPKDVGLAANWLAAAAKKQHVEAQAKLGEMFWRGDEIGKRPARGLALITLAHQNAQANGSEPKWIGDLYAEAVGRADPKTKKAAQSAMAEWGGALPVPQQPAAAASTASAAEPKLVVPASGAAVEAVTPKLPDADAPAKNEHSPVSVGFGGSQQAPR